MFVHLLVNVHSDYVILIAFPRQQCLCERASMLRYMYIACLVPVSIPKMKNLCIYTHPLSLLVSRYRA
jgi:hypothetical protein